MFKIIRNSMYFLIDFIIHIDVHLWEIINAFGNGSYAILFAIIFVETGLVIMPFLPGDSLLFAAGAFAARADIVLNIFVLRVVVFIAAIIWDTVNYEIGKYLGNKAFQKYPKIFKPKYLEKTESFYEKHGPMTIIYARFVPIVRTFVPFIAGVGKMHYFKFLSYNVIGGFIWTTLFLWIGYFFWNQPLVQTNFTLIIFAIIGISVLPMIIEWIKHKKTEKNLKSR